MHGTDDKTIPLDHAVSLYDALPSDYKVKPYWVIGKGHNNLDYNFDPLVNRLNNFLEENLGQYRNKKLSSKILASVKEMKTQQEMKSQQEIGPLRLRTTLPTNE